MFETSIKDILSTHLQSLPMLLIEKSLHSDIAELVRAQFAPGRLAIIDDMNTARAYGDEVARALRGKYQLQHITLPYHSHADDVALSYIKNQCADVDYFIAVGSGTINDLTKYIAHERGVPYLVFPTAASMNGYVSANASISMHGHKQSFAATLPVAVFMDMEVINNAPLRLAQAGLGDCLARPTAQADWLASHHLLGTAYDDNPYTLIAPYEPLVFDEARGILHQDKEVMHHLMKLLLLSGFGMTLAKSSVPASGGEHMIAHAYGMSRASKNKQTLHGEEIALTTQTCAGYWHSLLIQDTPPCLAPGLVDKVEIRRLFEETEIASFLPLYERKKEMIQSRFPDGRISRTYWEGARDAISRIMLPADEITKIAQQAGLAHHASQLGWDDVAYPDVCRVARFTRDRFTCLDLIDIA